jgi:uncharacterized membrane protein
VTDRILAVDWLRGAAVLVMIQCHAMVLLRPELMQTGLARWLLRVDGLVAPAFITAAGFSIGLVLVRAAAAGKLASRVRKSARRALDVFAVAYLGTLIFLPVWEQPALFLKLEILHCIALSLVLCLGLGALTVRRPPVATAAALAVGAAVFALSPLAEAVRGPLWQLFTTASGSPFPLFPWSGYAFVGMALGAAAGGGGARRLAWFCAALAAAGVALALLRGPLTAAYPPHDAWVTSPAEAGERLAKVMALALLLLFVEAKVRAPERSPPLVVLAFFGTSSLGAYFFHEVLLHYWRVPFAFSKLWGGSQGWAGYALLTCLLIALTAATCAGWDRLLAWLSRFRGSRTPTGASTGR